MSDTKFTVTVVAAFRAEAQAALFKSAQAHAAEVRAAAAWAAKVLADGLGFTAAATFGGGAGWDTEAGVTFILAGLSAVQLADARAFALALRRREDQQAVVFSVRAETFELL